MNLQQTIKEKYEQLPEDIQKAITSTDLPGKFNKISEKHGLHVDQNGSLQTETLLVMLGLERTSDYVDNLVRELDVSRNEAQSLAEDVNTEIFNSIRTSLRQMEGDNDENQEEIEPEIPAPDIAPIEEAGGFTIENNEPVSHSPQYPDSAINKENILKEIEKEHPPLVDHLLKAPVNAPQKVEKVEVKKTPAAPDPYREPIQ